MRSPQQQKSHVNGVPKKQEHTCTGWLPGPSQIRRAGTGSESAVSSGFLTPQEVQHASCRTSDGSNARPHFVSCCTGARRGLVSASSLPTATVAGPSVPAATCGSDAKSAVRRHLSHCWSSLRHASKLRFCRPRAAATSSWCHHPAVGRYGSPARLGMIEQGKSVQGGQGRAEQGCVSLIEWTAASDVDTDPSQ